MARLIRYRDPFDLVRRPFEMMPHWFGEQAFPRARQMAAFEPDFDMTEEDAAYVIRGDLPGVSEEELDLELEGNTLVVSGKRESEHREESEAYLVYERTYGSFSRSIPLPPQADTEQIDASLANGVLTVRIAKKPEHKTRHIPVKKTLGEKVKGLFGKESEEEKRHEAEGEAEAEKVAAEEKRSA